MTTHRIDSAALDEASGPLLFVNATIHTLDPALGDLEHAGLLLDGATVVSVGPGRHSAAEDGRTTVIDCTGLRVVPIAGLSSLAPGSPATFAVIATGTPTPWEHLLWRPGQAVLVMVDGRPRTSAAAPAVPVTRPEASDSPYVGMWIDESGFLHQELTAAGRYDETRGGRPHAYQGSFWIDGDRIVYLDDQGFWAYGRFDDGVLHHAGYVLRRAEEN
ncbi:hypothetical protein Aph02nite_43760 [Actinoplanes philippinensis]|uniref:Protein Atu4866 n=1 Tax=Actinoplanes philippinensis TaxID=35752 RepID=A0A1I2IFJ8_9ACTN|nr:Atu4866 domain-containing protein [Actinoplanes philippinensis]GIE78426.1 hypothetical protein Aph02nite_43760 [Actinoplanes philippinensis]SFF39331.1 protein Atu4866 [Actinoplanes philippinensis]